MALPDLPSAGPLGSSCANPEVGTVNLQVNVADAQGLRLKKGGEIRLVLTLRATDDTEGEAFGAKVTPWLPVPENEAPVWRARGAVFSVAADRCCQAEFVDSAHLHIALMQKGHVLPPDRPGGAPGGAAASSAPRGLGLLGIAAAVQGAAAAWSLGVGGGDRGEVVGVIRMPVGKRLVRFGDAGGGFEGASWVHLVESGESHSSSAGSSKVKGSLLLELAIARTQPPPRPSPPDPGNVAASLSTPSSSSIAMASSQVPAASVADVSTLSPSHQTGEAATTVVGTDAAAELPSLPLHPSSPKSAEFSEPVATAEKQDRCSGGLLAQASADEAWDSTSEGGAASDVSASRASTSSTMATKADDPTERLPATERPALTERPQHLPDHAAFAFMVERATASGSGTQHTVPTQWHPVLKAAPKESFEPLPELNIFTINDSDGQNNGHVIQRLLSKWSRRPSRIKPLKERLRSVLEPEFRQQRRDVRKWRERHEVFCVLNDMERRLAEVCTLLLQAAASMKRFGESHAMLGDVARLSAFLRDAGLYFKSEADVPRRLESTLEQLEGIADGFRSIPMNEVQMLACSNFEASGEEVDNSHVCEDLQIDIAVLLESALMAAQQALAEYKKMHCRLELLATEYEPVCRMELDATRPIWLPLIADDESTQEVAAATLPGRAVSWALDFSQLVGSASQGLEVLVKELEHRRRQLSSCAGELRELMIRRAACAVADGQHG